MPVLLPFRALRHPTNATFFIPGEEPAPPIDPAALVEDAEAALFLYRQSFVYPGDQAESIREGVMGLLDPRDATIYPHEQTLPDYRPFDNQLQSSSLFLWCHDDGQSMAEGFRPEGPPDVEIRDRFDCLHQLWRITSLAAIRRWQAALAGKELFVADGHHRFASGWTLATIQIRTPALRTLAAHQLIIDHYNFPAYITQPIRDIDFFLADHKHFAVVTPGAEIRGWTMPVGANERNLSALHAHVLKGALTQPVRGVARAMAAVASGAAKAAILVPALSIDDIEEDARRGILLPPKSTDFFPKLAGGLIMYRRP